MTIQNKHKALIILLIGMVLTSLNFWINSRYPDLGSKASLGADAPLSGLGFGALYEIKNNFTIAEKLFYGTLNWLDTNRRGMTFSFILGAFLLSILPIINASRIKGGFKNGLLGLLMGTPLGLCVNCSSPVARSMQASGMKLEAALALLISSPTMNIVVLSTAISLFPFYLVAQKVIFTLLFVLIIIPFACSTIFKKESLKQESAFATEHNSCPIEPVITGGWLGAILWSLKTYIKSFILIIIITAPLMVLAGFLGTAMVTFLPWEDIKQLSNSLNGGILFLILIGIAFIGALLPAPMAFDVAMSGALLHAGVPMIYVAVFLFTLGSYSIYAFMIVWQAISLRVANFLLLVTIILGLLMGAISVQFEKYYTDNAKLKTSLITSETDNPYLDPILKRNDESLDFLTLKSQLDEHIVTYKQLGSSDGLTLGWREFKKIPTQSVKSGFTKVFGDELGILQPYRVSYLAGLDIIPRMTTSIASGDVHNDGWEDLLILGDSEVSPNLILYSNIGGKKFIRQTIPAASDVILVALVDLNGDGWLDIVYATYNGENFVITNDHGSFTDNNRIPLNPKLSGTTNSMSFGDINKDGKLDVFLGNWNVGPVFLNNSNSEDILLLKTKDGYSQKTTFGMSGETLTSMFWDFDKDGHSDLYIGNDYIADNTSDLILRGDDKGSLLPPDENILNNFQGAQSTMSIDVGDINNDLQPEYFIGQIAYIGNYMRAISKIAERQISFSDYCKKGGVPAERISQCIEESNFKTALAKITNGVVDACENITDENFKKQCEIHLTNYREYCLPSIIGDLPAPLPAEIMGSQRYDRLCRDIYRASLETRKQDLTPDDRIKYHLKAANNSVSNILLSDEKQNGTYTDIAKERGVAYGGWTWNAKFADLDNDGWQDIYVTNGYSRATVAETKIFYHNKGDGNFEDATKSYGLEEYAPTSAYTYLDFDHDGDLDIISVPLDNSVNIFINNTPAQSHALQIALLDQTSENAFGLGAKVIIRYLTKEGKDAQQIRVVKGSGGYKSFDAPIAHFGLGDTSSVNKIEIEWPDGRKNMLTGDFKANGLYRITAQKK